MSSPSSGHSLELTEDPARFLAAAGEHLAADPVLTTVIASVTARLAAGGGYGADAPHRWWAVVHDAAGVVVGTAMRTAPFAPYPAYVLPMPADAAIALARTLHDRGEALGGVNGALPAARVIAEETARLTGAQVRVHEHLRLFELRDLVVPPSPPGRLRPATPADADLVLAWYLDFGRAAAEQAGRTEPHGSSTETFTLEDVTERIDAGLVSLWEDETGQTVHLTAASPPAYGVSRVGPVYTPVEHRGHGYAGAAVAEVTRRILDAGDRACLFTDQANPTSNRIYEALGYRPVVDMANLVVC